MLFLILNFFLSLSFAGPNACKIHEWVGGNSELSNSAAFWEEYGVLAQKGGLEDKELVALIAKHTKQNTAEVEKQILQIKGAAPAASAPSASLPSANSVGKYAVNIKKSVQKDLEGAQPPIREKFDKMLAVMQEHGPAALIELGKGNSNKLEHFRSMGKNAFSIRLDQGWRAVFMADSSGGYSILSVGRNIYKH